MSTPLVHIAGFTCVPVIQTYAMGGPCIQLMDAGDQGPVATATSWIPGLQFGEIAIKTYSENEGMLEALLEAGLITQPHRVHDGFPVAFIAPVV